MNPTIGFTNKYYTLWEVSDPYQDFEDVYTVIRQDFTYIQNLSFELDTAQEKAIEKYGEKLPVDESLRGRTVSFSNVLSRTANPQKFLFGKYKGRDFSDVDDIDYKLWYWSVTKGTDRESSILLAELDKRGMFIEYKGQKLTISEFEEQIDNDLKELNEALFPNGHYGAEGERQTVEGEVIATGSFNSFYGMVHTFRIATEEGSYYLAGSIAHDLEVGDIVEATGRIKWVKYWSDYHNVEVIRTELKRPKVIKK